MTKDYDVTTEQFPSRVLEASTPVLVDFWAPWCNPCKAIAPIVEEVADEYAGKMTLAKVNVDDHGQVASDYGVRGIPTLMLFHNGEVVGTMVGAASKEMFANFLLQHID